MKKFIQNSILIGAVSMVIACSKSENTTSASKPNTIEETKNLLIGKWKFTKETEEGEDKTERILSSFPCKKTELEEYNTNDTMYVLNATSSCINTLNGNDKAKYLLEKSNDTIYIVKEFKSFTSRKVIHTLNSNTLIITNKSGEEFTTYLKQ